MRILGVITLCAPPARPWCARLQHIALVAVVLARCAEAGEPARPLHSVSATVRLNAPVVLSQLPLETAAERQGPECAGMLRAACGDGARLVVVGTDGAAHVLSEGLHSACDPAVSFDGRRILFAGKRTVGDRWNIYEIGVDGRGLRQITKEFGDCRSPGYQSTLFTLNAPKPWHQIMFLSNAAGQMNEAGSGFASSLYSCKLDGSAMRRLTYNLSSDLDPLMMDDGRVLLASWQRARLEHGWLGRVGLFGVGLEGSEFARYAAEAGRRIKHMPCVTAKGLVVFVEADTVPWDGAGCLSSVQVRRPLGSYQPMTRESDGLFCTPAPLPDGSLMVSWRPVQGKRDHGVYRFDLASGATARVYDDPRWHDLQAKLIAAHHEPDGRSTVVDDEVPSGRFYCLSVGISDMKPEWWTPGTVKRLRVLEGMPRMPEGKGQTVEMAQRRILGEVPIEEDGSFFVEVPANTAIELQALDPSGMALRSCGWIWAKNRESRGCIGCHEDGELTPENLLATSVTRAPVVLTLPPARRRTVDFRRDVMPIVGQKCVSCHGSGGAEPRLDRGIVSAQDAQDAYARRVYEHLLTGVGPAAAYGKYVHPGRARASALIWHVVGRNTSRPWDGMTQGTAKPIPASADKLVSEDERQTFVEWIDLGAAWDGVARAVPNVNPLMRQAGIASGEGGAKPGGSVGNEGGGM